MKLIKPTLITDAQFVSSTVAEDDAPAWSSATSYTTGQTVVRLHKTWEALRSNTNKPPESSPLDWLETGPTNRWAMFDNKVGTLTTATASMTVALAPGLVSGLALIGLSAGSVQVVMTDTEEGVVYDRTFDLYDATSVVDWWAYFFEPIDRARTLIATDLPSYAGATLSVTLTDGESSVVSVGSLVVGRLHVYDEAVLLGASVGIQDYSRKELDDYGNWQITERAFSRRANWRFVIDNVLIDTLVRTLASLRAQPAVYIGSNAYDSTVLYGFYKDFDVTIAYPTYSEVTMEIESLT